MSTPPPQGPGPAAQRIGRFINDAVTRAPWAWRVLRRPVTRFFDSAASVWDARHADPERLAALVAALDLLPAPPERAIDIGTGTGAGALLIAERWPQAEVTAIDVAPAMIARAQAKVRDPRVRFMVADVTTLAAGVGYDLVVLLNMPPFFAQVADLVRPGGHVVCVASQGAATPFYTPSATLARGFTRQGLETVAAGTAGPGTYYLARRP